MSQSTDILIFELDRAMLGEPWYGASLQTVLENVKHENVFLRVRGCNHSIAEIALHILSWNLEIISRLKGNPPKEPELLDWPIVKSTKKEYWDEIKQNIFGAHKEIISIVKQLPQDVFENKIGSEHVPELASGFTFRESLLGLMQHNIYHGGQISLINVMLNNSSL